MLIQEKITWDADVDRNLAHLAALGVDCVGFDLPDSHRDGALFDLSSAAAATAFFKEAKARVAAHGMELRTVQATNGFDEVKRGLPGRDAKIEFLQHVVQAMGANGIPVLAYNFKILNSKFLRSQPTIGRGGASYISFDYAAYLKNPATPIEPPITAEKMLDNLGYFLKAIVPVAEKGGVRMALHPDDPPVPHGTPSLTGAAHIASNLEDYRRIFGLAPSAANGMLFCQGCVKEMQDMDVYDAIRAMGAIDKIVMVHFRNVRGSFPKFQEVFVDNGDVDMFRAMQAYRDVGFKGPFSLDHSPAFPGSQIANQAFVIGYLRALIQAVYR